MLGTQARTSCSWASARLGVVKLDQGLVSQSALSLVGVHITVHDTEGPGSCRGLACCAG